MKLHMARTDAASAAARAFLHQSDKRLLIDGEWVEPVDGERMMTIDPATGTELEALRSPARPTWMRPSHRPARRCRRIRGRG